MNGMGVVNGYGINAAQNRLNRLERQRGGMNYDYYDMNDGNNMNDMGNMGRMTQNKVQMNVFKGRPVSNFYEANASLIDMDGSLHVFPDFANKRIYTKTITLDGMSEIKTYQLVDNPVEELKSMEENKGGVLNDGVIGRKEFESYMNIIGERFDNIMMRLNSISENMMGGVVSARNGNEWNAGNVTTVSANDANIQGNAKPTNDDTTTVRTEPAIPEGTTNGKRKNG